MSPRVKGRPYNARNRQVGSLETRKRVLAAARQVLVARGYSGTTVTQIAELAGVNVDTVYTLVGRKAVILRELIEQAISGRDEAVAAEDRDYVRAMLSEPDPRQKLLLYAKSIRAIQGRLAPLFIALRDASRTEPEAHQVWQQISDRRSANMRKMAQDLRRAGGLREGLSVGEAGDVLWATNSSELYVMFIEERGWTPARYERWLAGTWQRLLLPD